MSATVLSSCPSRRSRSSDHLERIVLGSTENKENKFVLDLLSQLPPSAELLQHYQKKLEKYEEEEGQLLARIEACAQLLDNGRRLESEIAKAKQKLKD